jgi:hypothetical protein
MLKTNLSVSVMLWLNQTEVLAKFRILSMASLLPLIFSDAFCRGIIRFAGASKGQKTVIFPKIAVTSA